MPVDDEICSDSDNDSETTHSTQADVYTGETHIVCESESDGKDTAAAEAVFCDEEEQPWMHDWARDCTDYPINAPFTEKLNAPFTGTPGLPLPRGFPG